MGRMMCTECSWLIDRFGGSVSPRKKMGSEEQTKRLQLWSNPTTLAHEPRVGSYDRSPRSPRPGQLGQLPISAVAEYRRKLLVEQEEEYLRVARALRARNPLANKPAVRSAAPSHVELASHSRPSLLALPQIKRGLCKPPERPPEELAASLPAPHGPLARCHSRWEVSYHIDLISLPDAPPENQPTPAAPRVKAES